MSFKKFITEIEEDKKLICLLEKIKKIEIKKDLLPLVDELISWEEIKSLAEWGNMLASSLNMESRKKALYIASTLPYISKSKSINLGCLIILRKLGNFPAIGLVEKLSGIEEYKDSLGVIASLEAHILESLNSEVFFGKEYLLTNFQRKVVEFVKSSSGVSVSAPTSAGKSFIFSKILLSLIYNQKGVTAIYIVPTRALIRQVMNDFVDSINELNINNIYVGCTFEVDNLLEDNEKSNILVLTQERLFQLCAKEDINKLRTKIIVIDEAHNIENDARGVLLEGALRYAKLIWPYAQMLFSSPLISNPEKLLQVFNIKDYAYDVDTFPLVRQNILKVNRVGNELSINTDFQGKDIEVTRVPFDYADCSKAVLLAKVTASLWNKQSSIIYANEPMLSADIIRELINTDEFQLSNDERLNEFADFIEEHVHEKYELANFIRHGLAFHFGSLPAIVRAGIEDLFRVGAIKIVSCTSTLLEGLNMPAKNIFMFKPEKGKNKAIDKLSFWNLAGRAGRMGNDLVGNIICIELDTWKENPLNGEKLKNIKTATERRLVEETDKIRDYIIDRKKPSGIDDYNEQLASMIIRERIKGKKLEESEYATDKNKYILSEIDSITKNIISDFKPPLKLITNSPGIMPDRINDLWNLFLVNKESLEQFMPVHPRDEGKNRFRQIVVNINKFFINNKEWSKKHVDKIVLVSHRWMIGMPLSKIIFYRGLTSAEDSRKITKHIQDEIEFLNNTIRYQMVKYTQVYINVLKAFLIYIGKEKEVDKVINISSYLEYGACNIPALEFMSIGIPREAAIQLSEIIPYKPIFTTEYCHKWFKEIDIDVLEISEYLKKQLKKIQDIL
jgi:replicative superfamily II helicase